jgi:hypothetical protein
MEQDARVQATTTARLLEIIVAGSPAGETADT